MKRSVVVAGCAGAAYVALSLLVISQWAPLTTVDSDAAGPVTDFTRDHDIFRGVMTTISTAFDAEWTLVVGGAIAGAAAMTRRFGVALWLALVLGSGNAAWFVAKQVNQRERPSVEPPITDFSGLSFPSGHAASATLISLALVVVVWPVLRPAARGAAVTFAAAVLVMSAGSSFALGAHFPSDLLGGFLLAGAWVAGWHPMLMPFRRSLDRQPHLRR